MQRCGLKTDWMKSEDSDGYPPLLHLLPPGGGTLELSPATTQVAQVGAVVVPTQARGGALTEFLVSMCDKINPQVGGREWYSYCITTRNRFMSKLILI